MRAHRVLERAAVDLHRVGHAALQGPGRGSPAPSPGGWPAPRPGRSPPPPPAPRSRWPRCSAPRPRRRAPGRARRRSPRSGPPRRRAARPPMSGTVHRARASGRPSAPGFALLADQVHLVAQVGQRAGEAGVVDVAAGAPQQVAVEDQDSHSWVAAVLAIVPRRCLEARSTACAPAPTVRSFARSSPGSRYVDGESGEEFEVVARGSAARPLAERPALRGGEPPPLRLLSRAAGPEGPERLPALRPPAARRRGLTPAGVCADR